MKIVSLIERPAVLQQILGHVGLLAMIPSLRAPCHPSSETRRFGCFCKVLSAMVDTTRSAIVSRQESVETAAFVTL